MRSRSSHASRLTFHPIVIASAVVFVVLFLALGYHSGVSHEGQALLQRQQSIKVPLERQRVQLSKCYAETADLTKEVKKSNTRVKQLQAAVEERRKEQKVEEAAYSALDEDNRKCEVERIDVEARLRDIDATDQQNKIDIEEITKDVDALQVSIQQITHGDGMSIVLLSETVKLLRNAYAAKCRTLPGCVELTDDDLLALHVEGNRTEEEVRKFLERDAAAQKGLANALQGPSANLSGIYFLPTVDEESAWDATRHHPIYFNRTIFTKPLRGVKGVTTAMASTGTVVRVLESYSDYALCAYRYNNAKFSFQSAFSYPLKPSNVMEEETQPPQRALLHKLIVSPLLQYCVQCNANVWSQHYQLACFKNRVLTVDNYGTRDFWAVRSMIQAAPLVQKSALNYYESQDVEKKRVLAVVLHIASEGDREECDRAVVEEYGIHYQYLMANFPNDAALTMHIPGDYRAQCSPTPAQIIEHVQRVREAAPYAFDKIYLSVSADARSNVLALLNEVGKTELRDLLLPVYTSPKEEAANPGFTELVDLEIASRATDILVSPFMRASRYVTEEFLLRHKLNPNGHIWVF